MKPIATTRSVTGVPTGRLAVWWVIASEIVIFGGLLGSYIMHRLGHPEFGDYASHTNTWAGAFNTLVLLSSSLSAVLAHQAAERGNGKRAAKFRQSSMSRRQKRENLDRHDWPHRLQRYRPSWREYFQRRDNYCREYPFP